MCPLSLLNENVVKKKHTLEKKRYGKPLIQRFSNTVYDKMWVILPVHVHNLHKDGSGDLNFVTYRTCAKSASKRSCGPSTSIHHTLYMRAAKAQASLRNYEPSLLANAIHINTEISCCNTYHD